ncbi:MAG: helix-turn-helix domain-containing protein [Steroidobacteraceae bacterium]
MTPTDAEITELPSSPGARLRREREARGLSEQQVGEALTLDATVIATLEANDFAALGAPVYVKGHLRRYAAFVGLAEDEILGAYDRSKQHLGEPTLVPKSRLEMEPARSRPRWPWVLGGIAAVLLAAGLLAYLSENGWPWAQTATDASLDESAVPASGPLPESTLGNGLVIDASPPASAPVAAGNPSTASGTPGVAAPAVAAMDATPGLPPGPGQVSLQLRFTGDSWVEIFDGSGKAVLYDLGKAGSERTVTATAPLSVTLGNAASVAIAVNGRAQKVPAEQGPVARFSIGPDGNLR